MNNEEELKQLISQNGSLLFENNELRVANKKLKDQINLLGKIIIALASNKGDENEQR